MKTLDLLFDGDVVAYRASSAVQKDIDWGDGLWTCHAYLEDAIDQFKTIVEGAKNAIHLYVNSINGYERTDCYFAFTDPKQNFRKVLDYEYKHNRASSRKPTCYYGLVEWVKENYRTLQLPTLEADDVLGITATDPINKKINHTPVIISIDKDFKTIPCYFFDFLKEDDGLDFHSPEEAFRNLMIQTLTGDRTDNYKGCPTYGPVKAKRLVDRTPLNELWDTVVRAFEEQGLTREDALRNYRLAHILWFGEYDMGDPTLEPDNPVRFIAPNDFLQMKGMLNTP